jgi:hypothetical protein
MHLHQILAIGALLGVAFGGRVQGQTAPPAILAVDLENIVIYEQDTGDAAKYATDPKIVSPPPIRNFVPVIWLADIVAVNGRPAKGTWTVRGTLLSRGTTVTPGDAIADSGASFFFDWVFDIRQADGTQVGTIMASGWGGAAKPPGAPSSFLQANMTVTGGTGAFLGVRGQAGLGGATDTGRNASMTEDPAYRRINGGGARRYLFHLLPMERPEVVMTANGPAVVHASDFSLVTSAKPAHFGEILSVFASGLGPTRPGVDPGQPFPASPVQPVNSPVEVTVNGSSAEVLYAGGYPGAVDRYQVNFRVPDGTSPGSASLRLTSGFIPGDDVTIPMQ